MYLPECSVDLIKDTSDNVWFFLNIEELSDTHISFKVYEASSWEIDNTIIDTELYLDGTIKWDGCSHINFGDESGYIHICGIHHWKMHVELMEKVYKLAQEKMKDFDPDEIWK